MKNTDSIEEHDKIPIDFIMVRVLLHILAP